MSNESITLNGEAFETKDDLLLTLERKGLAATHEPIAKQGGGWVGIKKRNADKPKKENTPIGEKRKCRVYRSNVDPDNRDMPISVTVNTLSNKKIFWPGEEIELSEAHINVLRDSVEETRIHIPPESGIYASKDPLAVARNFYPNMTAKVNHVDNTITMVSRIPNYIIEITN